MSDEWFKKWSLVSPVLSAVLVVGLQHCSGVTRSNDEIMLSMKRDVVLKQTKQLSMAQDLARLGLAVVVHVEVDKIVSIDTTRALKPIIPDSVEFRSIETTLPAIALDTGAYRTWERLFESIDSSRFELDRRINNDIDRIWKLYCKNPVPIVVSYRSADGAKLSGQLARVKALRFTTKWTDPAFQKEWEEANIHLLEDVDRILRLE